jgi:hypothetical protein
LGLQHILPTLERNKQRGATFPFRFPFTHFLSPDNEKGQKVKSKKHNIKD